MKKHLLVGAAGVLAAVAVAPTTAAQADTAAAPPAQVTATAPPTPATTNMTVAGYILNNEFRRVWMDDGVKGIVKNYTNETIRVRDTTVDRSVRVPPQQAVVFYSDKDLHKFGDLSEGDGTWLEIRRDTTHSPISEFRLCDPTFGRPDTYFSGPGNTVNERTSWKEGESHHEITPSHKFWVKRESDSWKEKYDTWNSSDWPAFTIHVDAI